jgi:osmotically-inducible protein OsmY
MTDDDLALTAALRHALEASPELDGLAVRARVDDGAVVLFGQLANCEERDRAARITAHVTGVATVRNELTIRVSGEDGLVTDDELAARVRIAIAATEVDWTGVVVEVGHHVVRLRGGTRSAVDRSAVRHAVGTLSGVVLVANDITVESMTSGVGGASRAVSG